MSLSTSSVSGILSDNASSKWPGGRGEKEKERTKEGEKHKAHPHSLRGPGIYEKLVFASPTLTYASLKPPRLSNARLDQTVVMATAHLR